MNIVTFTNNPINNSSRIEFKRKGVSFIKKITGKGEKFLEGELLKELTYNYDPEKTGMFLEITYTETKEITLKDGTKKQIKKSDFVFVNFSKKIAEIVSYKDMIDVVDSPEINLYN